jgi:hypothetical protein
MDNYLSDDTYRAADGSSQLNGSSQRGGGSVPAGQWPAEMASEKADSAVVARLRLVQVYLTPGMDDFLRQARSMAITRGLDVTASAVVRHAMEQLMTATSPADLVERLGSAKGQLQPRRGRPRR